MRGDEDSELIQDGLFWLCVWSACPGKAQGPGVRGAGAASTPAGLGCLNLNLKLSF